jgi:hypothetical protein
VPDYRLKPYQTVKVSPRQEIVVGRLYADGEEFIAVRERVPGQTKTKGTYFHPDALDDVISALVGLRDFMTGGSDRKPGKGQGKLV